MLETAFESQAAQVQLFVDKREATVSVVVGDIVYDVLMWIPQLEKNNLKTQQPMKTYGTFLNFLVTGTGEKRKKGCK